MNRLLYFLLLPLLLSGCGKKEKKADTQPAVPTTPSAISGVGKILPEAEVIKLAMQSDGIILRIEANKNDSLKMDAPILQLDDKTALTEVKSAQATLHARQSSLRVAEAQLNQEQAKLENSTAEFNRIQRLYEQGAETGQVLDDKRTALRVQQAALKSAQETLGNESASLDEQKEALRIAQIALNDKTLRAPVNGTLLDLTVHTGEYVKAGDVVGEFAPASPLVASCEIDEMFAERVKVGQTAFILSSGARDTLARGKVIFTGAFLKKKSLFYEKPGEAEDRRVREVKILPDTPLPLMINSKIECSILIDK